MSEQRDAFDLDQAVQTFMRRLADKRLVNRECLDEVEGHLRDEIDDLMAHGSTAKEAFDAAKARFGSAEALLAEYAKVYGASRWAQWANLLSHYCDRRVVMRIVFGLCLGLMFMVGGLLLEGGQVSSLMQLTAAMIVAGGAFGALLIGYPVAAVRRSFVLALTGRQATRAAYLDAAKIFRSFGDLAMLSGFVASLMGLIHVFEWMHARPELTGQGLAVAAIGVLYGLLLRLFVGRPLHDSFMAKAFPSQEEVTGTDRGDGLLSA